MSAKIHVRLFVEEALNSDTELQLGTEQAHYITHVLRSKTGATIALFNGKDGEWAGEIKEITKRSVKVSIINKIKEQTPEPDVWLVFAPIKKARIDFVAQKATELGASHLVPIYTRRTIVDRVKVSRLYANAVEAAEQCERLTVPTINEPIKFEKLMAEWPSDRRIMFCDETLSGKPAHAALSDLKKEPTEPWAIFIGPEGGFDDSERRILHNHKNAVPVSLGPRIMRADTAAMAALSLWQSALGDW